MHGTRACSFADHSSGRWRVRRGMKADSTSAGSRNTVQNCGLLWNGKWASRRKAVGVRGHSTSVRPQRAFKRSAPERPSHRTPSARVEDVFRTRLHVHQDVERDNGHGHVLLHPVRTPAARNLDGDHLVTPPALVAAETHLPRGRPDGRSSYRTATAQPLAEVFPPSARRPRCIPPPSSERPAAVPAAGPILPGRGGAGIAPRRGGLGGVGGCRLPVAGRACRHAVSVVSRVVICAGRRTDAPLLSESAALN